MNKINQYNRIYREQNGLTANLIQETNQTKWKTEIMKIMEEYEITTRQTTSQFQKNHLTISDKPPRNYRQSTSVGNSLPHKSPKNIHKFI